MKRRGVFGIKKVIFLPVIFIMIHVKALKKIPSSVHLHEANVHCKQEGRETGKGLTQIYMIIALFK